MIIKGQATVVKHTGSHYLLSQLPQWDLFPAVLRGKIRLKGTNATNPVALGDVVDYEADAEAERILAKLRQGDLPENVTNEGNLYRYTCRVSELQALEVEVEITEASYRVLRWQMVSTTEWEADDSMNVWDGSME